MAVGDERQSGAVTDLSGYVVNGAPLRLTAGARNEQAAKCALSQGRLLNLEIKRLPLLGGKSVVSPSYRAIARSSPMMAAIAAAPVTTSAH